MKVLRWLSLSLRRQLMLGVALVHALLMSLLVAELVMRQRDFIQERQLDEARMLARTLALSAPAWMLTRDLAGLGELVRVETEGGGLEYVMLLDTHGQVLAHSDHGRVGQFVVDMDQLLADTQASSEPAVLGVLGNRPQLADVVAPVLASGRLLGWARVGVGPGASQARLEAIMIEGLLYTLLAIAIGTAIAWWMARRLTSRLNAIRTAALAVSQGHFEARAPEAGNDEATVVARSFNAMVDTLVQERAQLHTLIATLPDLVWAKDLDGRYLTCNPMFERLYNATHSEIVGKTVHDFLPAEQAERLSAADQRMLQSGRSELSEEALVSRSDGRRRLYETVRSPMRDAQGRLIGLLGVGRDITARREAENQLRLLASVFAASQEGILITDVHNRIVDVNPAFSAITGFAREEVLGQNPRVLASGRHDAEFYQRIWQSLHESGVWRGEIWNRNRAGRVFPAHLSITTVRNADGELTHYVAVLTDISAMKAHEQELDRIAHYDPLTGLPNRRLLSDRLGLAIAQTRRAGDTMAVAVIDLDGFKPINDSFGHEAGDQVLKTIAHRLSACLRGGDTVARLGGDEFVLVMLGLSGLNDCQQAISRVLSALAAPIPLQGNTVGVTGSIGFTLFPQDDVDADTLLRHADQAMYAAKSAGKNRYHCFDPEQDHGAMVMQQDLQRLSRALAEREFVLYYQPKVDLQNGEVVGIEALLRWQHPEEGLLLPGAFLPALKGSALEAEIGQWVLHAALDQLQAWRMAGVRWPLSINLSAQQLFAPDFVVQLAGALAQYPSIAPADLEIELLESVANADIDRIAAVLVAGCQLGVRFALDDYGSGATSLLQLRRLPIDTLKIDLGFVRNMLQDPEGFVMVESMVRLAGTFQCKVIAEGVETLRHAAALLGMGCNIVQGHAIARAMPAAELPVWQARWMREKIWQHLPGNQQSGIGAMLKIAENAHRAWVDTLIGQIDAPEVRNMSMSDSRHCTFGRWYHGAGHVQYGHLPEFRQVEAMHEALHAQAQRIEVALVDGQRDDARAALPELQNRSQALLEGLQRLAQRCEQLEHEASDSKPPQA